MEDDFDFRERIALDKYALEQPTTGEMPKMRKARLLKERVNAAHMPPSMSV